MKLLRKAVRIAVDAHRGQRDKSGKPYVGHPLRMMARLDDPIAKVVAVLHDVVEDTRWSFAGLRRQGFPRKVLRALRSVTKQTRGEGYSSFVRRAAADPVGRRVKLADLEDNLDASRLKEVTAKDLQRLRRYRRARQLMLARGARLDRRPDRRTTGGKTISGHE